MIMLSCVCFLLTSCFIFTDVLSSVCEDHGVYEEDGSCYWVTETNQSVDAGVTLCDVYGGLPARVFKSRHQQFFATLHQSYYSGYDSIYIGIRDWTNIGNYTGWLGFPLEDNRWGNGQPAANGKCVISSKLDSFNWTVVNCTESNYMACSYNINTQCHLPPVFSISLQPSPSSFSIETVTVTDSLVVDSFFTVIELDLYSTVTELDLYSTVTESDLYSTVTETDCYGTLTEYDCFFTESVCTSIESITITESKYIETTVYSTVTESNCASTITESVCGTTTTESDYIETTFYSTVTESDCASTITESVCGTTTTQSDLYSTVTELDLYSTVTETDCYGTLTESDCSFTESVCTSTESITVTDSNFNSSVIQTTFYSTVTQSDCARTVTETVTTTTTESDLYSTVTESDLYSIVTESDLYGTITVTESISYILPYSHHQTLVLKVTDSLNSRTPSLQITEYQSINTQERSGVTFSSFPQTSSVNITNSLTFAALIATSTNLSLKSTSLNSSTGTSVLTKQQVDEMVEQLKDAIEIDKKQTKSFLRRYNCARDPRISSTVVGSIGVMIIVLAAAAVVVLDFPVLIQTVQTAFRILKCAGNGNKIIESNVDNNIVDNSFEDGPMHV